MRWGDVAICVGGSGDYGNGRCQQWCKYDRLEGGGGANQRQAQCIVKTSNDDGFGVNGGGKNSLWNIRKAMCCTCRKIER